MSAAPTNNNSNTVTVPPITTSTSPRNDAPAIKKARVIVRTMVPEDKEEVAKVFQSTFLREPLGESEGVDIEEGRDVAKRALIDPVSFVVQDPALPVGHQIVAFRTSCIYTRKPHVGADELPEWKNESAVVAILDHVDDLWNKATDLVVEGSEVAQVEGAKVDKIIKFIALGVESDYEGMGLAKDLLQISLKNAKEVGCTAVLVVATAFATQHLFHNKLGFERVIQLKYPDFEWRGKRPFKNLVSPEYIEVYQKRI